MTDTMKKVSSIKKLIGKDRIFSILQMMKFIPDKPFLKFEYRFLTGKRLNLENPVTYNEKLQYLKLYDRKPVYTQMADKIAMRQFVEEHIGEGHTVPLYGTWDRVQDIDFDSLPDTFVIKCNHDSKGLSICRDKKTFNRQEAVKMLRKSLKRNHYWVAREWPYKNIKPRILAEELLEEKTEYQIFCFNGEPKVFYVADTVDGKFRESLLDMDYKSIEELSLGYEKLPVIPEKPTCFEQMKEYCRVLSKGCPQLRVDFYVSGEKLYVGELTFFNDAGFAPVRPEEWNKRMGSWISLPDRI